MGENVLKERLFQYLVSWEQDGKWLYLTGSNCKDDKKITVCCKVWDLVSVAKSCGYRQAETHQFDELKYYILIWRKIIVSLEKI